MFAREIECGLRAHYHGVNIRQWHTGEMSSREFLALLAGMPEDSWYKQAARLFAEKLKEESQDDDRLEVHRLIFAQLTGQTFEVVNE